MKKIHEAGQCPTTGRWFLQDYSLPHYQIGSWAIVFWTFFMINFRIGCIWPIYQSLDKRIWFTILFFHLKGNGTLFQVLIFFAKLWLILFQLELSRTELPKCTRSILMENCYHTISPVLTIHFLYDPACKAWLFEKFIFELEASYSFKIICILVRQVIFLKKMVVPSAKFMD